MRGPVRALIPPPPPPSLTHSTLFGLAPFLAGILSARSRSRSFSSASFQLLHEFFQHPLPYPTRPRFLSASSCLDSSTLGAYESTQPDTKGTTKRIRRSATLSPRGCLRRSERRTRFKKTWRSFHRAILSCPYSASSRRPSAVLFHKLWFSILRVSPRQICLPRC